MVLSKVLQAFVSWEQRGFIPGRFMVLTVCEIESRAVATTARRKGCGAVVCYDFKNVFPSVSHAFIHAALEALGLPANVRAAIRNL